MNITWVPNTDFVVNSELNREYSIVYDGSKFENSDSCVIPVKTRREVELLLLSLGEEATVNMDAQARKLCNVWDWLYGRTYSEVLPDLKWSYREEDEVLNIIEKIPVPKALNESFLRLHRNDPEPEKIEQEYVHKHHTDNVLISKPYRHGNMFYFNGFNKSNEFNIDHESDHLEGIVMFEAVRQAGIASVHLAGLPLSGSITILKMIIRYAKFVECDEPYLIRTIPAIKTKGGCSFGVFNMTQSGHSCASGYFTGIVYKSKESYQKFRNLKSISNTTNENPNIM